MKGFAIFILFVVSILNARYPEQVASLSMWMYRDVEPSDAYVAFTRIVGILGFIVAGFSLIFMIIDFS